MRDRSQHTCYQATEDSQCLVFHAVKLTLFLEEKRSLFLKKTKSIHCLNSWRWQGTRISIHKRNKAGKQNIFLKSDEQTLYKAHLNTPKSTCIQTFTAILPHPEVHFRNIFTATISMWEFSHLKDVMLYPGYVVTIVTQNSGKRCLLDLSELSRSEHTWVLIP